MREIHRIEKLCKICLSQGSRNIFDQGAITNLMSERNDLTKIAEKLRFVTLLKVSPMENLPQQICDLCIVQLNVSYNFKRLALKNDFYMRNYLIENGINVTKDEESMETTTTTALEIHQIQHNVIRTNRYRPAITEIRRNSTTSSVSAASTLMILNGNQNEQTNTENRFATPANVRPPMVRPIQIKTEPVDSDEAEKDTNSNSSSPSTSNNGQDSSSIVTISSRNLSKEKSQTPMVVINSTQLQSQKPAPLSVKLRNASENLQKSKTEEATKKTTGKKQDGYSPNGVKLGRPRKDKKKEISPASRVIQKKKSDNIKSAKKMQKNIKRVTEGSRISPRKKAEPKIGSRPSKLRGNQQTAKTKENLKKKNIKNPTQKTQKKNFKTANYTTKKSKK